MPVEMSSWNGVSDYGNPAVHPAHSLAEVIASLRWSRLGDSLYATGSFRSFPARMTIDSTLNNSRKGRRSVLCRSG